MTISRLDHVNLRTANLAAMVAFYRDVLGFESGPRPPFAFDGAWLYCGGEAAVHLVEVPRQPETREPQIEHFAFQAQGLSTFLESLRAKGVAYEIRVVPGYEIRQVNILDPDGNHLHIDFSREEEADLESYEGAGA